MELSMMQYLVQVEDAAVFIIDVRCDRDRLAASV
jgi:hypothetical protein